MYKRDGEKKLKSIEFIFMKCLSIIPRGNNPSKFACSTIKFKTWGCPPTRQARCIKTGRWCWRVTGGRRVKVYQIYSHTHRPPLADIWASVSSSRTLWQVDCGSPGLNSGRRICMTAIWVLIAVQISYESTACGTAVLGCVVWLLGTSRVDRLWLPYKAALPEGCELQINAEPRVNVKRAAV